MSPTWHFAGENAREFYRTDWAYEGSPTSHSDIGMSHLLGTSDAGGPSSYSIFGGGEHPPFGEPLVSGGAEDIARHDAAEDYGRHQLVDYLPIWFEKCKCYCP